MPGPAKLVLAYAAASLIALGSATALIFGIERLLIWIFGSALQNWLVRGIILLLVVENREGLPGVYHMRLLEPIILNLYLRPPPSPTQEQSSPNPRTIFTPYTHTSYTPLTETNILGLHKSASTYISSLDVAHFHLFTHLFGRGLRDLIDGSIAVSESGNSGDSADRGASSVGKEDDSGAAEQETEKPSQRSEAEDGKDRRGVRRGGGGGIALGSVAITYKRQIRPFQQYDIVSRIMGWDEKWIYVLSYFVRDSQTKKRNGKEGKFMAGKEEGDGKEDEGQNKKEVTTIYASAVSRYVFKAGRRTVRPEFVMKACGLLGEGWWKRDEMIPSDDGDGEVWDWKKVDEERKKGLDLVAGLEGVVNGLERDFSFPFEAR